jgi:hypothetical protein
MFKITFKSILKSFMAILIVTYGCTDETAIKKTETAELVEDNAVVQRILDAGFNRKDIVEHADHYVVEEDIVFYKKDPPSAKSLTSGKTQQARADFLVGPAYYSINVFLDAASFSAVDLEASLNAAIAAYNAVGSPIQLSRVFSAAAANIVIGANNDLDFGVCGQAGFPFPDGRPFDRIDISETTLTFYNLLQPGQLTFLVAHELGHCIGFRHTNWLSRGESAAIQINGTPAVDNASIMNGSTCGNFWAGFSTNDALAINILYANLPPGKDVLNANEQLLQNQFLRSADGRFTLYMQGDGNLVVYFYNQALWASNTCCDASIDRCIMQGDGNLVLYDVNNSPRWSSGTWGFPGSLLVMQSDGNLVIYQGSTPRWASNTCCY